MWIFKKILWFNFINLIINSVQDSWLKSTFDCRIFPLGLNTLDNARENEIRPQLYQSYKQGKIYRCGDKKHFASTAESVDAWVGTLRSNDTDARQREGQRNRKFNIKAKQQLCTCITLFLYISLPFLHDYDVKMPYFTF